MTLISDKRILVTGANGYVGTRLCEKLYYEHNARIVAFMRKPIKESKLNNLDIRIIYGDILDKKLINGITDGIDVVVNLIAGSADVIINGTRNISRAARMTEVKQFIHMSSAAVYGIISSDNHLSNNIPGNLTGNPYSDAKIIAEKIISQETHKGLQSISFRPRVIWGPNSFWVNNYFSSIKNSKKFYLLDGGKGACNTIFIDNLIETIITSIQNEHATGKFYFITDDEKITWRDFYEALAKITQYDVEFININADEIISNFVIRNMNPCLSSNKAVLFTLKNSEFFSILNRELIKIRGSVPAYYKELIKKIISHSKTDISRISNYESSEKLSKLRILREAGSTFTDISLIKNDLNYKPKFKFSEGISITSDFLKNQEISIK